MIHVVGRFVAVVEKVLFSGLSSFKVIFKTRKFFFVFYTKLNKCRNIFNLVHALSVSALPHHRKFSACNLTQKVVDISPVLLTENNCRTDDSHAVWRICFEPVSIFFFCKKFRASVIVEIFDFSTFVSSNRRKTVNGNRTCKNDSVDSKFTTGTTDVFASLNIHFIVKGFWKYPRKSQPSSLPQYQPNIF